MYVDFANSKEKKPNKRTFKKKTERIETRHNQSCVKNARDRVKYDS